MVVCIFSWYDFACQLTEAPASDLKKLLCNILADHGHDASTQAREVLEHLLENLCAAVDIVSIGCFAIRHIHKLENIDCNRLRESRSLSNHYKDTP